MGCTHSSLIFEKSVEENLLLPFEKALGFGAIECQILDSIFHRYSLDQHLTLNQFSKALKTANLNLSILKEFCESFNEVTVKTPFDKLYSTTKLNCLGVLLSKGTISSKIHVLFQNYDIEANKKISKGKILLMLDTLVAISLEIIPNFLSKSIPKKRSLRKYIRYLKVGHTQVLDNMFKAFVFTTNEITYQEFYDKFSGKEMKKFLNPRKLRIYAFRIAKELEQSDNDLQNYLMNLDLPQEDDTAIGESSLDLNSKYFGSHRFFDKKRKISLSLSKIIIDEINAGSNKKKIDKRKSTTIPIVLSRVPSLDFENHKRETSMDSLQSFINLAPIVQQSYNPTIDSESEREEIARSKKRRLTPRKLNIRRKSQSSPNVFRQV